MKRICKNDSKTNVFLSSRQEDKKLKSLRSEIFDFAKSIGLSIWQPPIKTPGSTANDILFECLHFLSQADVYICILVDTYGTIQEELANLSILELEIIHSLLSRKTPYFFAIEPFNPTEQLSTLLKSLEIILPNIIQRCSRDIAFQRIKKILRLYRFVKLFHLPIRLLTYLEYLTFTSRKHLPEIKDREASEVTDTFLSGKFAPYAFEGDVDKDFINTLIEKAIANKYQPTKLVLLWAAIRHLSMVPYDVKKFAKFLPLWNRALSLWASAAAWAGFHGKHLYLGRLPAVNTLLKLRDHASKSNETLHGQVNGAIASEYYSMAKRTRSKRKRRELLEAAIDQVQKGLDTRPDDPSGLLLILGSIMLVLNKVNEAVSNYEKALNHRVKTGATPSGLGEAKSELGFGYLRQGRKEDARKYLEEGVKKLKQSEKAPGFTVRAMKKLALYYLLNWQIIKCITQNSEAYEIALSNGIHGQITTLMRISHLISKYFCRVH